MNRPDADRTDASPPGALGASDREVLATAMRWLDEGHPVELVTVARTWGSSPRPEGSMAAVRRDGRLVGSVSGGCIETRLVEESEGRTRTGSHEIADEEARRVGLTCGGRLELVFEDNELRMAAMRTDLHGSVNDFTPIEAVQAVMSTTTFRYRIEADKIFIYRD